MHKRYSITYMLHRGAVTSTLYIKKKAPAIHIYAYIRSFSAGAQLTAAVSLVSVVNGMSMCCLVVVHQCALRVVLSHVFLFVHVADTTTAVHTERRVMAEKNYLFYSSTTAVVDSTYYDGTWWSSLEFVFRNLPLLRSATNSRPREAAVLRRATHKRSRYKYIYTNTSQQPITLYLH